MKRRNIIDLVALYLSFGVIFEMTVAFEATLYEFAEFYRKGIVIE